MKMLAALLLLMPLWACDNEGPLERAGEEIDEAARDIGDGRRDSDRVDDAVDDVRDGVDDARDELRDRD